MQQKLSDYVADFLAAQGIRHVFVVTGGASIHILHSLHDRPGTTPICPHHEQAGAMAAPSLGLRRANRSDVAIVINPIVRKVQWIPLTISAGPGRCSPPR